MTSVMIPALLNHPFKTLKSPHPNQWVARLRSRVAHPQNGLDLDVDVALGQVSFLGHHPKLVNCDTLW
jgi:hypothetical protein